MSFTQAVYAGDMEDALWQETYDARQHYFETAVGPLPPDIIKMLNMTGVWPGGGLFEIPAHKLGAGLALYTTFGFTNPDMPTARGMTDFELQSDGKRATHAQGMVEAKPAVAKATDAAGYGYEMVIVTRESQKWPINFLQWAVNSEMGHDAGWLSKVEK
ncbi:hypothetical protein ACFPK6_18360 [Dokdonella soli]